MPLKKIESIPLRNTRIDDRHWNQYIRLVTEVILPYQWDILNDRVPDAEPSYCIQNFKIAAGEMEGQRRGMVFQDSDLAKWLEAVGYSLEHCENEQLERLADEAIDLVGRAQCLDGYLNTYFTLVEPDMRWRNLTEGHELYTAGHFIEAAVAYYRATGKDKLLNIVCRFADLIGRVFGPGDDQIHGYPGHQEIELALVKLYRTTGNLNYLQTAKYFIDARGHQPNYFLEEMKRPNYKNIFPEFLNYTPVYSQSHLPVREQTTAEGHAVRAAYMYCAMADLAYEYNDQDLLNACETIWHDIVYRRMYITGSIGSSSVMERFTTDYDLPNDINYSETCASIGLALFGLRMAQITREARYIDTVERALYNTVLAGIALSGDRYFYVNPLEVWPDNCLTNTAREHVKPERQRWFSVACCPPNIARTLASIGQYIYGTDESSVYINLFIRSETEFSVQNTPVHLLLDADFPKEGKIRLRVQPEQPQEFSVNIRIPAYAQNFTVTLNGCEYADYTVEKGYAHIARRWETDATVDVSFDMKAKWVRANPGVRADVGRAALVRGPQVYCLEEQDNGKNLAAIMADCNNVLEEIYAPDLFGGTVLIKCKGMRLSDAEWGDNLYGEIPPVMEPAELTAVPYCYWNNRSSGEMLVWIHEKM